ncbi:MAG: cobalt ECF transporter T component CbiQ [bacterium]|nr:cobalt ECF transporter T component CbiQ [bacterium]
MGANSIDYYAYTSNMRNWNAAFKLVLGIGTLVFTVAANRLWIFAWVFLSMSALTVCVGRLSVHVYVRLLSIPLIFLLLGALTIAVEVAREPLAIHKLAIGSWYLMFTRQSVSLAVHVTGKALAAVSALYLVTLSTSVSEILGVLEKLHLPSLLIELMHLIYRYIFVLMDTTVRMRHAAESRLGYGGLRKSLRTFGQMLGNLFLVSLKKANRYYEAMEARCYDGGLHFLQEEHPVTVGQAVFGVCYFGVLLVFLAVR